MSKKNKKLAEEWVDRAESDLQYARAGEKETAQHHITCFLCHQAVEKILKGLLVFSGEIPPKTHHVGLLISKVSAMYPALGALQTEIRRLDKYYIPARYPDDTRLDFTPEDANTALEVARKVLDSARQEIR